MPRRTKYISKISTTINFFLPWFLCFPHFFISSYFCCCLKKNSCNLILKWLKLEKSNISLEFGMMHSTKRSESKQLLKASYRLSVFFSLLRLKYTTYILLSLIVNEYYTLLYDSVISYKVSLIKFTNWNKEILNDTVFFSSLHSILPYKLEYSTSTYITYYYIIQVICRWM